MLAVVSKNYDVKIKKQLLQPLSHWMKQLHGQQKILKQTLNPNPIAPLNPSPNVL
jgi:hypothetical protein